MKRTENKKEKRTAILAAAEKLFRERWVHELTLDEIAAEAGVGKGTIYLYFKNKDDLLFALATEGFDALCSLVAATPREGEFAHRLESLAEAISDFFQKRHAVIRMIHEHEGRMRAFRETMRKRWIAHRRRLVDAIASVMRQGIEEGVIRPDFSADLLAILFLGMMRTRDHDAAEMTGTRLPLSQLVEIFLQGVARREASGEKAQKRQRG